MTSYFYKCYFCVGALDSSTRAPVTTCPFATTFMSNRLQDSNVLRIFCRVGGGGSGAFKEGSDQL